MSTDKPLFAHPVALEEPNFRVWILPLDRAAAIKHVNTLVGIHTLIPFVEWGAAEFLSDAIAERVFHRKWQLSILLVNAGGEPIGFLIGYLRAADSNFERDSVYMHRMAIVSSLQRRGIGSRVVATYLEHVFREVRVDYITLQTNDNFENSRIIAMYESLGFVKQKQIIYPEKTDWLMACPRFSRF